MKVRDEVKGKNSNSTFLLIDICKRLIKTMRLEFLYEIFMKDKKFSSICIL